MKFEFPTSKCDVRPEYLSSLESFRERLLVWDTWLSIDEHSIWNQITRMLWNDMIFRSINECRRIASREPSPQVGFNGSVATFIDQSYVATQLLAVRRLTERNVKGDAITLYRLLDDMKKNAGIFTRENYVCNDGLPFDPGPARERTMKQLMEEAEKNDGVFVTSMPTTGPDAYDSAVRAHESFDRLTGVDGRNRSRDDRLDSNIFDLLKSKLSICDGINTIASKFIAHAADAGSRNKVIDEETSITMRRIEACHRVICRVAAFINGPLLYIGGHGLIPIPQFDDIAPAV
ncbi:MAG: hypothetical protein ACYC1L_15105 [Alphaproteobacteria bacterium]